MTGTGSRSRGLMWTLGAWTAIVGGLAGSLSGETQLRGLITAVVGIGLFVALARVRNRIVREGLSLLLASLPLLVWIVRWASGRLDPLEGALVMSSALLVLAMLANPDRAAVTWCWGFGIATCVVGGLFVAERFCLVVYTGTCLLACASLLQHRQVPLRSGVVALVIVGLACTLAALSVSDRHHISGHHGALPISGGTAEGADSAMRGTGQGPDVVTGTHNARTAGFDQSDVFMNSDSPGLYDVFVESFGEPRATDQQKMIALKQDRIIQVREQAELDLRQGKRFELRRAPPPAEARKADAPALLWVDSNQPQHLPLMRYDQFDGQTWHAVRTSITDASLQNVDDPRWFQRADQTYSPMLVDGGNTTITIGQYGGEVLPMPPYTFRFRMGRVDRTSFFQTVQLDLIRIRQRVPPPGTVIEASHRLIDLNHADLASPSRTHRQTVVNQSSAMAKQLAEQWTQGTTAGWGQVRAVVDALRNHARLDRTVNTSADADPVDVFLRTRSGGAHQFASTLAVMLHHLGYDVRYVTGLYANPAHRDERSGQILVQPADGHAWCEIRTSGNAWLTIDPSPGYTVAAPVVPWWQRLSDGLVWAMKTHSLAFAAACSVVVMLILFRRRVADAVYTGVWHVQSRLQPAHAVAHTARLLERRARLWNCPRRESETVRRFVHRIALPHAAPALSAFADLFERFTYARRELHNSADVCRQVGRLIGRRTLQQAASSAGRTSQP